MKVSINIDYGGKGFFKPVGLLEMLYLLFRNIRNAEKITISKTIRKDNGDLNF